MQEKLRALIKKFKELPTAAKVAAAAGCGLLLYGIIRVVKGGSATKSIAANQYAESDGTIIYPYAVDYTGAGESSGNSTGGYVSDGYYATSSDLAAVVDAMTAGNTMLLERIDSAMQGTDVTNGNITPQTYAEPMQAGVLDNSSVLSAVTVSGKVASDGKIYATGGTGKQYVYNPSTGNIMVNGRTVTTGSANYNATMKAMLADGVSIPGSAASSTTGSASKSASASSKSTSSIKPPAAAKLQPQAAIRPLTARFTPLAAQEKAMCIIPKPVISW